MPIRRLICTQRVFLAAAAWGLVVGCVVWALPCRGDDGARARRTGIEAEFSVTLPEERRPMPEPLPVSRTEPGFTMRGTKGWKWLPEQYLSEIPILARYKMNFLMNCYVSMFDIERQAWNSGQANRWWEPLPESKKRAYEAVARACQPAGIQFCFSMNPNFLSPRPLNYASAEDLDALWRHYEWMAGLGVRWFSICLDDISQGIDAKGQAAVVNKILHRLRAANRQAEMVFCPTYYWGTGEDPKAGAYLETLAAELDPAVYCFWTGDAVVGRISRSAAEQYKGRIRHRLFIWDNYPVNDANPTLHLGPVTGRDPDLCEVAEGYMSNPLCPQNEINRIPLLTIADFAYNPGGYDPGRSIGQAILHLADTAEQRRVLKDLVELYPGMLLEGKGTNWNPVIARFKEITSRPHSRYLAELYLRHVEDVADRLARCFPDRFQATRRTVEANLAEMRSAYNAQYLKPGSAPASEPGSAAARRQG